jgi:hypothetical protein
MNYIEKKAIANAYLEKKAGVYWDDLPDINSLHDADAEDDVIAMCNARLQEEGFPENDSDDGSDDYINYDYLD